MPLRRFVLRRLLLGPPVIFGIAFLVFMLIRIGGQDPAAMLAGPNYSPEAYNAILRELGLDRPLWDQFALWLGRVLEGDLGRSWLSSRPVLDDLLTRLPVTFELIFFGVLIGAAIAIPTGLRAAAHAHRTFDQTSRMVALVGFSMPTYWLGLVAVFVFFYLLDWTPPPMGRISDMVPKPPVVLGAYFSDAVLTGSWAAALSAAGRLLTPVLIVAIVAGAPLVKQVRAVALDVLSSDCVRFAHAQGLGRRAVWLITLRHSLVPIITFLGSEFVGLLGLVSIIEYVFSWGGIGQFGITAIIAGDFAVVQGYVLLLAVLSFLLFLLIDVWVFVHDPRGALAR